LKKQSKGVKGRHLPYGFPEARLCQATLRVFLTKNIFWIRILKNYPVFIKYFSRCCLGTT